MTKNHFHIPRMLNYGIALGSIALLGKVVRHLKRHYQDSDTATFSKMVQGDMTAYEAYAPESRKSNKPERDIVAEASDDSFPASDPPPWSPSVAT